jgi:hypothetical protein
MNILYLSCHAILEHDEVKLLTELNHNVFALGSYINPKKPHDNKRPGFKGFYDDHLQAVAIQYSKENLHQELIDWADVIIVMHRPDWILNNWSRMKHKKVIWRTIGQSQPQIEGDLALVRGDGLKIVRYSPLERTIEGFAGEDAVIRFYKNSKEFKGYTGEKNRVITVAQSMKRRNDFCGFNIFEQVTNGMERRLYGPDNEDSGIEGGLLSYADLKKAYRENRVYFYTGTYPASYTLNFMEALMTGIPIVAIGKELANLNYFKMDAYEVDKIIENGVNGFVSNNITELREYVQMLLNDHELAKRIGQAGRETAIKLFDKELIKNQWRDFLC